MSTSGLTMYPCDRGMPNAYGARGYHHFEVTEHGVCCRYCGVVPPSIACAEVSPTPPHRPPPLPNPVVT